MPDALSYISELFDRAGVEYAVIGAHAVNAWLEPRATADLDITVCANPDEHRALRKSLEEAGYTVSRTDGTALPSGPDFVRFHAEDRALTIEVQTAKTELQRSLVKRAVRTKSSLRIATPEDLIVLKLIAYRAKDRIDLLGLVRLEDLDWTYIREWVAIWQLEGKLDELLRDS